MREGEKNYENIYIYFNLVNGWNAKFVIGQDEALVSALTTC